MKNGEAIEELDRREKREERREVLNFVHILNNSDAASQSTNNLEL
jgi:hypothetical protein